jgi:hydroxyacylglutathione hydrolase
VQAGKMVGPGGRAVPAAPKCRVQRSLVEGDEMVGFRVLDTPGHSPGHVSYWRESDRVLICGDVIWGRNPFLNAGPPQEPFVNADRKLNRQSARRLAQLDPQLVCFGHGAPLREASRFRDVVARLPD